MDKMAVFCHFASEFQEADWREPELLRKSDKMHNRLLQFHQILLKIPLWGKLIFLSVALTLKVPLKVSLKKGANWADMTEVKEG